MKPIKGYNDAQASGDFERLPAGGYVIKITGVKMRSSSPITIPTLLNGRHVTRIGKDAFRGNAMITGVTIPGSIVGIEDFAFYGCPNLADLTILDGVTRIDGLDAFRYCKALRTITFPKSLKSFRIGFVGRGRTKSRKILQRDVMHNQTTRSHGEHFSKL